MKRLQTVLFQLYDSLEKAKNLWMENRSVVARGSDWEKKSKTHQGVLEGFGGRDIGTVIYVAVIMVIQLYNTFAQTHRTVH